MTRLNPIATPRHQLRAEKAAGNKEAALNAFLGKKAEIDNRCCQTNENSHRIACAALIYALNSWRHSVRAAVRLILKLSRE